MTPELLEYLLDNGYVVEEDLEYLLEDGVIDEEDVQQLIDEGILKRIGGAIGGIANRLLKFRGVRKLALGARQGLRAAQGNTRTTRLSAARHGVQTTMFNR